MFITTLLRIFKMHFDTEVDFIDLSGFSNQLETIVHNILYGDEATSGYKHSSYSKNGAVRHGFYIYLEASLKHAIKEGTIQILENQDVKNPTYKINDAPWIIWLFYWHTLFFHSKSERNNLVVSEILVEANAQIDDFINNYIFPNTSLSGFSIYILKTLISFLIVKESCRFRNSKQDENKSTFVDFIPVIIGNCVGNSYKTKRIIDGDISVDDIGTQWMNFANLIDIFKGVCGTPQRSQTEVKTLINILNNINLKKITHKNRIENGVNYDVIYRGLKDFYKRNFIMPTYSSLYTKSWSLIQSINAKKNYNPITFFPVNQISNLKNGIDKIILNQSEEFYFRGCLVFRWHLESINNEEGSCKEISKIYSSGNFNPTKFEKSLYKLINQSYVDFITEMMCRFIKVEFKNFVQMKAKQKQEIFNKKLNNFQNENEDLIRVLYKFRQNNFPREFFHTARLCKLISTKYRTYIYLPNISSQDHCFPTEYPN